MVFDGHGGGSWSKIVATWATENLIKCVGVARSFQVFLIVFIHGLLFIFIDVSYLHFIMFFRKAKRFKEEEKVRVQYIACRLAQKKWLPIQYNVK